MGMLGSWHCAYCSCRDSIYLLMKRNLVKKLLRFWDEINPVNDTCHEVPSVRLTFGPYEWDN